MRGGIFLGLAVLGLASNSAAVGASEGVAPDACAGQAALYDPEAAVAPDSTNRLFPALAWLPTMPVAFVASGDACLGPVPVWPLALPAQDWPARDTHALARRLAPAMAQWSDETGMEACARMCGRADGQAVARLVTLRSHISCAAPESTCPDGSVATAETIHSHPPRTAFMANAVDAVGWDEPGIAGRLTLSGNPNTLSPPDRAAAPVWVVTGAGRLVWLETPDGQEVERP